MTNIPEFATMSRKAFLAGAVGFCGLVLPARAFAVAPSELDAQGVVRLAKGMKVEGASAALLIDVMASELTPEERVAINRKAVYEVSTGAEPSQTSYDLGGRVVAVVVAPADEAVAATGASDAVSGILADAFAVTDAYGYLDSATGLLVSGIDLGTPDRPRDVQAATGAFTDPTNGSSYYNLMACYAQMLQVESLVEGSGASSVCDAAEGVSVDVSYLADAVELVREVATFDPALTVSYDHTSPSLDCIAAHGAATMRFHIAAGGWWGYALTGNSIIDKVFDVPGGMQENIATQTEKGNFFDIDYGNGIHLLKDADIQNPIIVMDDASALVVDVDYYGAEVFHDRLMGVVGDRELSIYITHQHGDHLINLQYIDPDEISAVYYPKEEPASGPTAGGVNIEDCLGKFDKAGKLVLVSDGDVIETAGREFEVVSMKGHTPGGTQLLDKTDRLLFAGDTLGSQTFKGGTTIKLSEIRDWQGYVVDNMKRHGVGTDACTFDYIITGHTSYKLGPEFIEWLKACVDVVADQGMEGTAAMPSGRNIVSMLNGRQLSLDELTTLFATGVNDAQWARTYSIAVTDDSAVASMAEGERGENVPLAFGATGVAFAGAVAGSLAYRKKLEG